MTMHAYNAYIVCMKKNHTKQYTLRGIPERTDAALREKAKRQGKSLNTVAIEALQRGLGLGDEDFLYHDLDDLAGTWVNDPEFDKAMIDMDQVDEENWK